MKNDTLKAVGSEFRRQWGQDTVMVEKQRGCGGLSIHGVSSCSVLATALPFSQDTSALAVITQPKYGPCNLALEFSKYLVYIAGGSKVAGWRSTGPLMRNLDIAQGNQLV